ncbi:MAG: site-specific integrase [Opitutaceae bacterium]|nr:site-specific integrase [Opitutaceae bacterium]
MNQPIILTNGEHEVKIYTVRNRDRWSYQLSFHEGGKRERKTFGKLSVARREAKLVLNRLAVNGHDAAELSTADMESYVIAKKHIEPTGLPLHVCAETFAQAHAKLGGRTLLDAVDFFLEFNRADALAKTLPEMITAFAEGRTAMGVHADYIQNIKRQLGRLVKAFPGRTLAQYRTAELDKWLAGQPWMPLTKNDVRKILITFGNWAKARSYLPVNRPTEFDGMVTYKVPPTKVEIYAPAELQKILPTVQANLPELLPWVACAAFTGARVKELGMLSWESINFERAFVEVASTKIRTKARRLVPLHDALRAWLLPYRKEKGLITDYADPHAALNRATAGAEVTLRDNGFRHSYISYRVAQINDTARVALECGNSPEIIFQHYRELVGPDEATAWFGSAPALVPVEAPAKAA